MTDLMPALRLRGGRLCRAALHVLLVVLMLGAGALVAGAGAAHAQSTPISEGPTTIDQAQWERQAWIAEALLDDGSVSEQRLTETRSRMVKWREVFQAAQSPNNARIAVLKAQIEALGPVPAEGESEPQEVTARRSELNAELAKEQAPSVYAAEAYGRADSIIRQIDLQLRERQRTALLHVSPSPVLPSSWASAIKESTAWLDAAIGEVVDRYTALPRDHLRDRLPMVALFTGLAILVLIFGRRHAQTLPQRFSAHASHNAREAVSFLVSLLQILLPYAGIRLIVEAAEISGLFGAQFRPLLGAVPGAALTYFAGRWVVLNLFPLDPAGSTRLRLTDAGTRRVRRLGTLLVLCLGVFVLVTPAILPLGGLANRGDLSFLAPQQISEAAAGVWHLALVLIASVLLYRLGIVLQRSRGNLQSEAVTYRYQMAFAFGIASRIIAIAAPLLVLAGYVSAANSLIWPWLKTLGLVGLVLLMQQFVDDLWIILKGGEERARNALAPVLIGFALAVAALPVLALIWGERTADLVEVWTQLRGGLQLGGITISPAAMVTFAIVFTVALLFTRIVQAAFNTSILPKTRLDSGAQNAVVSGIGYLGIFLAALLAITSAGIDMSSLAIVAGALSVGIGFGLQTIVSNFVAGIILLIERPVAVGDWVEVGGVHGTVQQISVRSTVIQTFDRTDLIVPNSDFISGTVTNYTRRNLQGRVVVTVTLPHGADSRAAEKLLIEIAEDQPLVLVNPAPSVYFTNFTVNGIVLALRVILADINQVVSVETEIRHQIAERFQAAGLEMASAAHQVRIENTSPPPESDPGGLGGAADQGITAGR